MEGPLRTAPAERRLLLATTVARTAQAFLLPFAHHYRRQGYRVDLAAAGAGRCRACREAFDRVVEMPWSRAPWRPGSLRGLWRLRRLLARERYDLLHVHTPVAAFVTRAAAASLAPGRRPRLVYTAHGFHFHNGATGIAARLFLGLEKAVAPWTDGLIVINREDEAAARRYGLVEPGRLWHVPGIGIDTQRYRPEAVTAAEVAQLRGQLGLNADTALFVMVAEFNPGKRHRDAVAALAELARHGRHGVHLAFAGTGPEQSVVRAQVARLGLQRRVHFLGFRHDVPVLMRAATATVMPSEREGLNRSVMESLALEVPVVGSDARGVRDLLEGGCGVVVPVGDVAALAGAMAWVVDHPEQAREMARLGRQRMVTHHDVRHVLKLHDAIYRELLEGAPRAQLVAQTQP